MTHLQSVLSLQINFKSPLPQYLPNQTTNNEYMKRLFLKKYEKQKLVELRTALYQSSDTKKNSWVVV